MKTIIYAIVGIVLYAIQNAIIDVKLKQHSTVGILLGLYITLLPLAAGLFLWQKASGQPVGIPSGKSFIILASVAVMFFVADFFYIGAYTSGGNVVTVTIVLALMPVIGGLIKFFWVRDVPNVWQVISFGFALLAVICIAIGNTKASAHKPDNPTPSQRD
jgi:drug/metabolite transporter (DMT)-like permease